MTNLRKAAEQALEAFEKIYEGCGEVKKNDLNKHSNGLAILVRKDCLPQIEALRQALAQPKREWVGLTDEEIYDYADKFLYQHGSNYGIKSFGKAIEAKLKEKNT